ncbi:MarR family transcriptional regulator [Microbacterium testaceum]|uniref:MarR family winged helix-turn-helix transcriptional regulator n=1 Tax=Microbacterium testaceum TaxID=2033 RepID=UPI0034304735
MPRRPHTALILEASAETLAPVVSADGLNARGAMQAFITWATSTSRREELIRRSAFPVPDDMLAFLVVSQLAYQGSARPTELANATRTGRSNLSKVLRRLEEVELVGRMVNPDDGRETRVALTPNGREVAERIIAAAETDYADATAEWTEEERVVFNDLFVRLVLDLDRRVGGEIRRFSGAPWSVSPRPWDPRS